MTLLLLLLLLHLFCLGSGGCVRLLLLHRGSLQQAATPPRTASMHTNASND